MFSNNNCAVLMTACIDPSNGSRSIHRSDPIVRMKDYEQGLRFWLNVDDPRLNKIVFVENSGYSLETLKQLAASSNPQSKQVEFISLSCNSYPEGLHYGYAELNMIDLALDKSQLLQESDYFIKVTGRLTFPGLPKLLNKMPNDFLFSVDSQNNSLFVPYPQRLTTTQLMVFSTAFYKRHFVDLKSKMNEDAHLIELLFYKELLQYKDRKGAIMRWPINVDPVGYAAHWDKKYNTGKQRIINSLRSICRVLLPQWWV